MPWCSQTAQQQKICLRDECEDEGDDLLLHEDISQARIKDLVYGCDLENALSQ